MKKIKLIVKDGFLMYEIGTNKSFLEQNNSLQEHVEQGKLSFVPSFTFHISKFFFPISDSIPNFTFYTPELLYLNLDIYREPRIKSLIKKRNNDLYQLIKKVHFDGKCYRIKCVRSGKWEHSWELAIQIKFFGMMYGLICEPQKIISRKDNKIIYRSLILINRYELWNEELVEMFWNLQERIEFQIAKILFHECIHFQIFLGKTSLSVCSKTDIFLEFREMLKFANSEKLCPESCSVKSSLQNLVYLTTKFPSNSEKRLDQVPELYEFLIHEKYSFKKTDMAFGFSLSNKSISQNYAKIAALKLGGPIESNKKFWKMEVKKLQKDLEELYNRIDELDL